MLTSPNSQDTLPLSPRAARKEKAAPSSSDSSPEIARVREATPGAGETPPAHLLVVDDGPVALQMWKLVLPLLGYRVTAARDGAEALDQLARARFDLLMVDQDLTGMAGIELAARVKARYPMLPVVVLSGQVRQDAVVPGAVSGVDLLVGKPCGIDTLKRVVAGMLAGATARAAAV
jgi:CheY-like chemotaxis protein